MSVMLCYPSGCYTFKKNNGIFLVLRTCFVWVLISIFSEQNFHFEVSYVLNHTFRCGVKSAMALCKESCGHLCGIFSTKYADERVGEVRLVFAASSVYIW